jgi:predicted ABC-type ATPase
MKFKEFVDVIVEANERHAAMAFGRLQPPTTGHAKLVDKVKSVAARYKASHHVVLSHSNDAKSNPLSAAQKVKHAKRFFPKTNITTSSREHPTFLHQARKLHKAGNTHLHMIAGGDRIPEFKKLLNKYNGTHKGAMFNFKQIKLHNAGARNPNAKGTAGMSASKLRGHATTGNYNKFRQGVPKHVSDQHARELYKDLRSGMRVREDINSKFEQILIEGVHDKGIFKAVFLAGGPGSGKDYVLSNTLDGLGLTEINSDKAFEYLLDKNNMSKIMSDKITEKSKRDAVRGKAKSITELKQKLALMGRNGLIINGTGEDVEKISRIKEALEKLGYTSAMVMVNTEDNISAERNVERGQKGGRTVPEDVRKAKWDHVQRSRPKLAEMFGQNYVEFDNSLDLRKSSPDDVKRKKDEMTEIFKFATNFIEQKPDTEIAQSWIAGELQGKDSSHTLTKVPDSGKHPHPESKAKEEAGRLGLDYYGFGRYGKDNAVSHRVVHDTLVPVTSDGKEPKVQENINIDTSFEDMLEESVAPGFPEAGMSLGHTAAPESYGKDPNMSFNSNFGPKKRIPQSKYKAKKEAFPDDEANDVKQHSDVRIIKPKKPYTVSADGNKIDPVSQEGTADGIESISANNNQKLHNQGIRLATWKARNSIGNFKGITNMSGGGI